MKRFVEWFWSVGLAAVLAVWVAVPTTAVADSAHNAQLSPAAPIGWASADLTSGSVVVKVMLAGQVVDGVLDTGASHTVIDRRLATSLGLTAKEVVSVGGGRRAVEAARGEALTIEVAGRQYQAVPILMDLSSTGLKEEVIIGRDFFDLYAVEIDFAGKRVRVLDHADLERLPPEPVALSSTATRILSFPVTVAGHQIMAELDLGSQVAITMPSVMADDLAPGRRRSSWVLGDVSGWSVVDAVVVPELTLFGTRMADVPAMIVPNQSTSRAMTVGMPVLMRFSLVLNLGQRQIWLTPSLAAGDRPFRRDRSGLALTTDEGILRIVHVARSSPSEWLGLPVDSIIAEIDGEPVSAQNISRLARMGFGDAGSRHSIRLSGGQVYNITLRDYY